MDEDGGRSGRFWSSGVDFALGKLALIMSHVSLRWAVYWQLGVRTVDAGGSAANLFEK